MVGMNILTYRYSDVTMNTIASQVTGVATVCLIIGLGADQRKHQSSMTLWGIHC